jgi:SulP family sulfate permease
MIVGALLVYLGISLFYRWAILTRKSLPRYDYYVLLLILVVIAAVNLLAGVILGTVATFALFAINYSRIHVVRNVLSGMTYQSNVDRAPYHHQYLLEHGEELVILKLQGFIFFGTAFQLFRQVRERAENQSLPPLRFLVLDFRLVNGVDSSALNSFVRMLQMAETFEFKLALADLADDVEKQLVFSGILSQGEGTVYLFPDMDHAVEWCENKLLYEGDVTMVVQPSLKDQLRPHFLTPQDVDTFLGYLERQKIDTNTTLIQQGDPPNGIYFVAQGSVRAELALPNGETVRLRTMSEGTIVGELGIYLQQPASANVVTEFPSTVYYLSSQALAQMEQDDPKIAAAFHKYLATVVSKRLLDTNTTVHALMD